MLIHVEFALYDIIDKDFVPGRVSLRAKSNSKTIVDVEIHAIYQKFVGGATPTPTMIIEVSCQPQLTFPKERLALADIPGQSAEKWRSEIDGWEVVPATLALSAETAAGWQADVCIREPSIPFCEQTVKLEFDGERDEITFSVGNEIIGIASYSLSSANVSRPHSTRAAINVATLISSEMFKRTASALRSAPAFTIRRKTYERTYWSDDYTLTIEEDFVGATSFIYRRSCRQGRQQHITTASYSGEGVRCRH